jgi:cytidine deaminase
MVRDVDRERLVDTARAATAKAFLTSTGGTAYGAAVLCLSGRVYSAGQYSSWNHMTNVHAEQGAVFMATMNDDPDVLALAVASTGNEPLARPCGVCRQVMLEHAARTGRDFEVLMARRDGTGFERSTVRTLLPEAWSARGQGTSLVSPLEVKHRETALVGGEALTRLPEVGDHLELTDGTVAMVWDGAFDADRFLAKLKYTAPGPQGRRKIAHSFTEPLQYQAELAETPWSRSTPTDDAAVAGPADVARWYPALPLTGLPDRPPGPVLDLLREGGADVEAVRVTGSRCLGLHHARSDWDLVVPVPVASLRVVRERLLGAVRRREMSIPDTSGSWKLLAALFPGGQRALLEEGRFVDTVHSAGSPVALIFVPPEPPPPLLEGGWEPLGRACLHGTVTDASQAPYKRGVYRLRTEACGELQVVCFHKAANLLREGDRVAVRGWLVASGPARRLVQMLPVPDNILWHDKAKS